VRSRTRWRLSMLLAELVTTVSRTRSMIQFSDGVQTAVHLRLVVLIPFPFLRPESTAKTPTPDDDDDPLGYDVFPFLID
jgi:hypothetical protein